MRDRRDLDELLGRQARLAARAAKHPERALRLRQLQSWQAQRLARTYDDLRRTPDCAGAVEFFLTDLYGPHDQTSRDRDLTRAWRKLKRALPSSAVALLERSIELQVLTAELDQAMLEALGAAAVTGPSYSAAYRAVDRAADRRRQIELVVRIGADLDRLVRRSWVMLALRAAHVPAHAAGLGALQDFLERGFAAFRKMKSARPLLAAIRERETRLMAALLSGSVDPFESGGDPGERRSG
jgi:hypothetical protein